MFMGNYNEVVPAIYHVNKLQECFYGKVTR